MKKRFFMAMLVLLSAGIAFGQLQSNKTAAKLGYDGAVDVGGGDKKFSLHFNTNLKKAGDIANDGKGILSIYLSGDSPANKVATVDNRKAENWGANANIPFFPTVQSLIEFATKSDKAAWEPGHQYWKPANLLINNNDDANDQVMAAYPGMFKRVNLGIQVSVDGGGMKSDISFEIMTADLGNTGKTAVYKMIVSVGKESKFGNAPFSSVADMDAASSANIEALRASFGNDNLWVIDNVYTTSAADLFVKDTVNIAEKLDVSPGFFNGKKVYITLYTSGTGANIEPGTYDPVIAIDNFEGVYAAAAWAYPENIVANGIIDHNNGSPVVDEEKSDYGGGDPVEVPANELTPIKFYITSLNRAAELKITEANDGGGPNMKYSFAETGAVKSKDADGNFTLDVPYSYTPSDGLSTFKLEIPSPDDYGIQNDTLELTILVKVAENMKSSDRLEITNGVRFWYDITALGVPTSSASAPKASSSMFYSQDSKLFALHVTQQVLITNLSGQLVKEVTANQAKRGVSLNKGVYLVQSGKQVEKVIVE